MPREICNNKIEYGPGSTRVVYCELKYGHGERDGTKCATRIPIISSHYYTAEELNKLYAVQQPTAKG